MTTSSYSVKQLSDMFNVHPNSIRNWIMKGKLEAYKFDQSYRITQEQLDKFLETHKIKGE